MSNLLLSKLARERVRRDVAEATRQSEHDQFERLVSAMHRAFEPHEAAVKSLKLIGEFGVAVPFEDRPEHLRRMRERDGLKLRLGWRVETETIWLTVHPRRDGEKARVEL